MSQVKGKATQLIRESQVRDGSPEGRNAGDTIRLWENHREQAILWRSIALLQIPATLTAMIFAIVMWTTRSITLNVPSKPLPGSYPASDLPDTEFIDSATEYLNLTATYQPATARRQFMFARELLKEPLLSFFDREMMVNELQAIEGTARTQIFFADPTKTQIERKSNLVRVAVSGERLKIVAGRELPTVTTRYIVTMTTIPRNATNPYGIVITEVKFENDPSQTDVNPFDDNKRR